MNIAKRFVLFLLVFGLLSLNVIQASAGTVCPNDTDCSKPRIRITVIYPKHHGAKELHPAKPSRSLSK